MKRTAIFIDGENISYQMRSIDRIIDWKALLAVYRSRTQLLRFYYFSAVRQDATVDHVQRLLDWLDFNGFTVVSKPTKSFTDSDGQKRLKGNLDVEISVYAMETARHVDEIVLFSADGDFRCLVEALQRAGVRVTVAAVLSRCAHELRRQADDFVDLSATDLPIFKPTASRVMEAAE